MSMIRLFSVLALSALLAACGGDDTPPPPAEKPPVPAPAPEPTPEPEPEPAPEPMAGGTWDCLPGDAEAGQKSYVMLCASCHGATGDGSGIAGQALDPKPARHDDGGYMNALSTEHLFTVINDGGAAAGKSPLMAPWGAALGGEQGVWDVVAFVRTLADPPFACE